MSFADFILDFSLAAGAGEVTNLYSVTYNTNNSTGGTTPATQTAETNSETYTFAAPQQNDLVRAGYGLAGWSEDPNATSPQYNLGGTITLSKTNPSKTLYAVWVNWSSTSNMQDMLPAVCQTANIGDSKNLTDTRDGTSYSVKKLSDGKCWMTQNLRIVNKAITPADSDVTSNYTIPASSSPWSDSDPATNKVHYANNTTYGAYYTWYTATAGTSTSVSSDGQNASSSICPKGWRLPTSKAGGEFEALNNLYPKGTSSSNPGWNSTNKGTWFSAKNESSGGAFFPAGGYVYSGSLQYAGSNGCYWSSTTRSASNAYLLYFNSSIVIPSSDDARYRGLSVRCVAR